MQELINNGFVLSVKYTDEYDARVKILLDNGNIVNLNALGLQKPNAKNAAALQPFNLIEVEFFQSENATWGGKLKRATLIETVEVNDEHELNRLGLIRDILIRYESIDPSTFILVVQILNDIQAGITNISLFLTVLINVLKKENIVFQVDACGTCGSIEFISSFDLMDGGLLCKICRNNHNFKMEGEFLRKIIRLFKLDQNKMIPNLGFTPQEEKIVKEIFINYLSNNLGLYPDKLAKI